MTMRGEKIYECDYDITGVTDYGITLMPFFQARKRFHRKERVSTSRFAGTIKGRVTGSVRGVDYLRIRADGRIDQDIRATIETNDGHRIGLYADGVGAPRAGEPIADICQNVRFITAAAGYAWVHTRQIWAVGQVNFATRKLHFEGYQQ